MGQVSALVVRSNLSPEDRVENGGKGYSVDDPGKKKDELDYVQILNGVLPSSIRALAWCPVSEDFSARFSCRGRHYRYFFVNMDGALDIDAMRKAASYFVGENDFRNFCKLDVQKQINNFKRRIHSADILPYDGVPVNRDSKMYTLELHGSAFLWHQVRCMMAILFLVGQKLEEPEIVQDLLDIEKYPTKPEYEMAHDVPLVLYDCKFDGLQWQCPENGSNFREKILRESFGQWHDLKLRETLAGLLCVTVGKTNEIQQGNSSGGNVTVVTVGDGSQRPTRNYRRVAKRTRQEAFEVMNERYRMSEKYERQQQKMAKKEKTREDNGDIMEE
jgi:tRNA pseudouridine38/39 synthase